MTAVLPTPLIAAVFPVLPPEAQRVILEETNLAAAVATVLALLGH
jgi:hypothetical protein